MANHLLGRKASADLGKCHRAAPADENQVELSAEKGLGPNDGNKGKTIPKGELPAGRKEGGVLEDRAGQQATVTRLSDTSAAMDYHHPLAGKPLRVKIKAVRVDNPS